VITNNASGTTATLIMGANNGYGGIYGTIENGTGSSGGVINLEKAGTGAGWLGGTDSSTGWLEAYGGTFALATSTSTSTTIWVMAGTLQMAYASALTSTPELYIYGGTLDLNGYSETLNELYGSSGTIITNNSSGTSTLTVDSGTFGGNIQNGSGAVALIKSTSATLTLTGTNTSTGGTTINAGYVDLGGSSALSYGGGTTINGGTLDLEGHAATMGALAGSGGFITNSGSSTSLTIESGTSSTFSGSIQDGSGSGHTLSLVKLGTGTETFNGSNGNTGGTTIEGGTIMLDSSVALCYGSAVVLAGTGYGATLDLNGLSVSNSLSTSGGYGGTLENSSSSPASLAGAISIGSSSGLTVTDASAMSLGGAITGAGPLTKTGAGTVTVSAAGTYSGATTVSGGTLQAGGADYLSSISTYAIGSGCTLDLGGNSQSIGSLSGAGIVTDSTSGTNVTLTTGGDNTSTTFGGVIQNGSGASVALTQNGTGALTLSGINTYTGATTISEGTVQLGYGSSMGSVAGNIADSGALVFDNPSGQTVSNVVSGSGTVSLIGAGALTFTGTSTGTGTLTINNGTLDVTGQMSNPITINPNGTLGGPTSGNTTAMTGPVTNYGGVDLEQPFEVIDLGWQDANSEFPLVSESLTYVNDSTTMVLALSMADAAFKTFSGSATTHENSTPYTFSPSNPPVYNPGSSGPFSFTEYPENPTDNAMITFTNPATLGGNPDGITDYGGSWNLTITPVQGATLTVTNMAPVTFSASDILSQVTLASGFDASTATITSTADVRGGDLTQQDDGTWVYSPHNTDQNGSPWDPYYPYGDDPTGADGTAGGASFTVAFADGNGNTLMVSVNCAAKHSGYLFAHASSNIAGANWVASGHQGTGGLLLAGGLNTPLQGHQDFVGAANDGDIVIIGNWNPVTGYTQQKEQALIESIANDYATLWGAVHAVDVFDFITDGTGTLTADALAVATDTGGTGLGHEFIDKLNRAAAFWVLGGDQWPDVQLLQKDTGAAGIVNNGYNGGKLVVGGTSAGLAILGNYVYTAQYTRTEGVDLTSSTVLSNVKDPQYYQNPNPSPNQNSPFAVANNVLQLSTLTGIVTETHFDGGGDPSTANGSKIYRLGRLISDMGVALLTQAQGGYAAPYVYGLGVSENTALWIQNSGQATVLGSGYVYFASVSVHDLLSVFGR